MNHHPLMPVYRGLLAVLLFVSAQAFAADGVIQSASGDIFINGSPASQGDEVSSGDTLRTAFGAWMIVEMDDQSVLDIRSNTEVQVANHVYNPANPSRNNQDVNLVDGTLRYTSGLIATNDYDDVVVRAGDFTVGIRGTLFEIAYDRSTGKVKLTVTSGRVRGFFGSVQSAITDANGEPVDLSPGESIDLTPDGSGNVTVTVQRGRGTYEATYSVGADGSLTLSSLTRTRQGASTFTNQRQVEMAQPSFNQAITNTDE